MKFNTHKVSLFSGIIACLFTLISTAQPSNGNQNRQQRPTTEEIFKMMDANEDGKLSLKEVKGPLSKDFSKIDIDENGFITKEELENAPKPERQRNQQQGNSKKQKPNTAELFKEMDTDNDGKLSKKEVRGHFAKGFEKIDTDEDGFLTQEELENAPKAKRK